MESQFLNAASVVDETKEKNRSLVRAVSSLFNFETSVSVTPDTRIDVVSSRTLSGGFLVEYMGNNEFL